MDFGVVSHKQPSPTEPRDENGNGSVNLKHQRSDFSDDSWRLPKMPKPGEVDFSSNKTTTESSAAFGRSSLWPSAADDGQKMLSFSSAEPRRGGGDGGGGSSRSIAFSICQDEHQSRAGGGGINGGVRGPFARLKGPFTPSQWMELEHQALIYKHIVANVPVPSNLLVPIKRSLYSYGSYASNLWWGPFQVGYSGSNDPEPGRCRRTDGKKWRCSRDAVPDQKYCERHINRGRHRSRKPVEIVSPSSSLSLSKLPPVSSSPSSPSLMSTTPNAVMHHHFTSMQPPNSAAASTADQHLITRSQGYQGLSLIPPSAGPKSKEFSTQRQQQHELPFVGSSPQSEFGFVSSDSLLNPSNERIIPYNNTTTDHPFLYDPKEANNQQSSSVHHFIDDWPKEHHHQSNRVAPVSSWPEELKSDWTQLSMSIPTHETDPTRLGEPVQKQSSLAWLPASNWGNEMGGPLGEVLTSTGGAGAVDNFSSDKGWRSSGARQIGSSPTGVLQKSTFVSLSNSSSGSSPPMSVENNKKVNEGSNICSDLLGSALASSAPIQSL